MPSVRETARGISTEQVNAALNAVTSRRLPGAVGRHLSAR
jgi:hypothetical protein